MSAIIECKNLTHYYGQRKIYENLSFEVPQGRILGLLGKNGTGKTTTINILSGYLQPHSGASLVRTFRPWILLYAGTSVCSWRGMSNISL